MKAKNEGKKSSNCETTTKPLEKEKKEETKTSSTFTFKDFQKSIDKKESDTKTSIPTQNNSNSSLTVEKRNDEKLTKEELKKEKEKEKKTKDDYEDETESESESDIEFESDDEDDDEYKIVKIKLIPFIFTEKYDQVKGFIKDSRITCYSFLNVINNGIMSDNEYKEIEDRIKDKLSEILFVDDEDIKLKLDKSSDSRFYVDCYVKINGQYFKDQLNSNDD